MQSAALELTKKNTQSAVSVSVASFAQLLEQLNYLPASEVEQIRLAYRLADQAHLGQKRKTGEPYITHPIAVAQRCASWRLDAPAIMAALLHDTMEDCGVTKQEIIEQFGAPVAELVDGLTKLDAMQFATRADSQAESFRKMILATARDMRVILIKLADRLHNMQSMHEMPRAKRERIASETMNIYAPLANRLGLNAVYLELQDLAFQSLHPWRYHTLQKALAQARGRRRDGVEKALEQLRKCFHEEGLQVEIAGREKSLYSIHRKMVDKRLSFAEVLDVFGVRILLPTLRDCYTALGVLHQAYHPLPGTFKDYIAIPKNNGYQSLHSVVSGPAGIRIEVQLRSQHMHHIAQSGVAAHWLYKTEGELGAQGEKLGLQWIQSLMNLNINESSASEFWEHLRVDLHAQSVYVMTPKGAVIALPRGATALDFAYAIHSRVGDSAIAVKVNEQLVPLRTEMKNGNKVEIITGPKADPNPAWLSFVRTARARSAIRAHLKNLQTGQAEQLGRRLLAQALRSEGYERLPSDSDAQYAPVWAALLSFTGNSAAADLFLDLCLGKKVAALVAKRLVKLLQEIGQMADPILLSRTRFAQGSEEESARGLVIDGSEGGFVKLQNCCHPIPGEFIVAYLGHGEGVHIHTQTCKTVQKLQKRDTERLMRAAWADEVQRSFEKPLHITGINRSGFLAAITQKIAQADADITAVELGTPSQDDNAEIHLHLAVRDVLHFDAIRKAIETVQGVSKVLEHIKNNE